MKSYLKTLPLLLMLVLTNSAIAKGEIYCCVSAETFQRVCSDLLPPICRGKNYRVLDSSGNILREVGPPLTAEQKQKNAEELNQKKMQESAVRIQRRRDQALLDTYTSADDIETARNRTKKDIESVIVASQAVVAETEQRKKRIEGEIQFFQKQDVPQKLLSDIRGAEREIQTERDLIALKQRELQISMGKYDSDRLRYLELTGSEKKGDMTKDVSQKDTMTEQTKHPNAPH